MSTNSLRHDDDDDEYKILISYRPKLLLVATPKQQQQQQPTARQNASIFTCLCFMSHIIYTARWTRLKHANKPNILCFMSVSNCRRHCHRSQPLSSRLYLSSVKLASHCSLGIWWATLSAFFVRIVYVPPASHTHIICRLIQLVCARDSARVLFKGSPRHIRAHIYMRARKQITVKS